VLLSLFLRGFFRELYTRLSWAYDGVAWLTSMGQWFDWQRAAYGFLENGSVLEIAIGTGHVQQDLAEAKRFPVGVDPSSQMVLRTRRRLRIGGHTARLARAEAKHLPFADQSFSVALSTFPSEFIFEPESLSEIWRVLKPAGRIVVVPMARIIGGAAWDRLAGWLYQVTGQSGPIQPGWADPFRRAGFRAEVHEVALPRAKVAVITGDKLSGPAESSNRRSA
jgi:ubiquinone/menaquinone biosynthesis C-methylase UbiE